MYTYILVIKKEAGGGRKREREREIETSPPQHTNLPPLFHLFNHTQIALGHHLGSKKKYSKF